MDLTTLLSVPTLTAMLATVAATITDIRVREVPDWVSGGLLVLGMGFALVRDLNTAPQLGGFPLVPLLADFLVFAALMLLTFEVSAPVSNWLQRLSAVGSLVIQSIIIAAAVLSAYLLRTGAPNVSAATFGLAAGYTIGAILYYTGQWGGGDAKLLMGIGATLTLPGVWLAQRIHDVSSWFAASTWLQAPLFVKFLVLTVLCGAAYGLCWMLVLCLRHWSVFRKEFGKRLGSLRAWRIVLWSTIAVLLVAAIILKGVGGFLLVVLAAIVYVAFYLMVAIKIAETQFMLKTILAAKLTEGDWVVGGARVGKTWIIPEDNIGATKEQIAQLTKRAPRMRVVVKEGIPFVPSFLAAFIIALL